MATYTPSSREARQIKNRLFQVICVFAAVLAVTVLAMLIVSIIFMGGGRLSWDFLADEVSSDAHTTGIFAALMGSVMIMLICALSAVPLGVATAVLLEEYRPHHRWLQVPHNFVQNNITNLAGVPSIVYGILGFTTFVLLFGLSDPQAPLLSFGQDYYHQYTAADTRNYFVPIEKGAEKQPVTMDSDLTFYATIDDAKRGENPAEMKITDGSEIPAIQKAAERRLRRVRRQLSREVDKAATGEVFQIDQAQAGAMADEVLTAAGENLNAEPEALKASMVTALLEMNGVEKSNLMVTKEQLQLAIVKTEMAASGLAGLMKVQTVPQVKTAPKWYYFQIPFGKSVIAGGLTLMLVILPVIIVASQEAIRAVSNEMRSGVLALGGTKWQSIQKVVLPSAVPGICTGTILALSRAIGEAAPILLIGFTTLQVAPDNLMAKFAAMPLQIYHWTAEPEDAFRVTAAAGIIVLLAVLLSFNAIAVFIRQKTQKAY